MAPFLANPPVASCRPAVGIKVTGPTPQPMTLFRNVLRPGKKWEVKFHLGLRLPPKGGCGWRRSGAAVDGEAGLP